MGLTGDESWDLTPREFDALCRRLEARMDWQSALSAQTPWTVACALGKGDESPSLEEFMLTRASGARRRREEQRLMSAFGAL